MGSSTLVVSGHPGRLARAIGSAAGSADGLELLGWFNPGRTGEAAGLPYLQFQQVEQRAKVVVEAGPDDSVLENLSLWRDADVHVVVGTSGFTAERQSAVDEIWEGSDRGCLIVPNFSIGAVLAMRFAEEAARHFATTEVVERHRAGKPDAPSGTALHTAERIAAAGGLSVEAGEELVEGARGGDVAGIRVHSLRLEGVLSHQEVAFSNPGEQFSIVHQSTSYDSFGPGAVAAIRAVGNLSGVHVGLDAVLG